MDAAFMVLRWNKKNLKLQLMLICSSIGSTSPVAPAVVRAFSYVVHIRVITQVRHAGAGGGRQSKLKLNKRAHNIHRLYLVCDGARRAYL